MILPQTIIIQRCVELPNDLTDPDIRALNEIGKSLRDVLVQLPSQEELDKAKAVIERILLPKAKNYYVIHVLIGYEYARTHYRNPQNSLLDDIINGNLPGKINLAAYDLCKIQV